MSKCARCGKRFLFQKVDSSQHCKECARVTDLERQADEASDRLTGLRESITSKEAELKNLSDNYDALYSEMVERAKSEALAAIAERIAERERELGRVSSELATAKTNLDTAIEARSGEEKKLESAANRLVKMQAVLKSLRASLKRYYETESATDLPDDQSIGDVDRLLEPTVKIHFHSMDVRELKKRFSQNAAVIRETLARYQDRYTTKANIAIYQLMVIGLEAELQNTLYNLKYDKLQKSLEAVRKIIDKYDTIASSGNQSIAPTVKKFVGEVQYLYEQAIRIEYDYYVKKERIKEEQRALREQMREEAAEKKRLEEEQRRVQAEESKYLSELENLRSLLADSTDELKRQQLADRIDEVKGQLDQVEEKKEGILRLQNGKAGYVYIISNLGSFGENVFKIGMTRRLEPLDRVYELGDASVPFRFDVHCMVFSDNAPDLESSLHKTLHQKRLNKINLRREYFVTSVDELEELVYKLEPSAEFTRTMLAEEFRQSQEIESLPDSALLEDEFVEDDEAETDDVGA